MNANPQLIDKIVSLQFPIMGMPRDPEAFQPLKLAGTRYILGQDGLYQEFRRAWLYARLKIASVETPYAPVSEILISRYKPQHKDIQCFVQQAKQAGCIETAAWVVWNEKNGESRYIALKEKLATTVSVVVDRPVLEPGEHLVLDLHSHHHMDAFFSSDEDDTDDLVSREVKFAMVLGRTDKPEPDALMRLCIQGHAIYNLKTIQYGELP